MLTVQVINKLLLVAVPVQAPLHPAKLEPVAAVAVKITSSLGG